VTVLMHHCIVLIKKFLAAVIDIDTSGIRALEDLYKSLQERDPGISLKVKSNDSEKIICHNNALATL
jgi:hypothetical protein